MYATNVKETETPSEISDNLFKCLSNVCLEFWEGIFKRLFPRHLSEPLKCLWMQIFVNSIMQKK